MIQLIVGVKGTGKTKTLIDMANEAIKTSKGHVVCLEKGNKLTYDISHNVRLIDVEEYRVTGFHTLLSFTSGILASDYDVTDVFIDSALKIGKNKIDEFEAFIQGIEYLAERFSVNFTITSSCDPADLPESLKKYVTIH
ncbi:MAG: hypothetical protein E7491_04225 [Ruminococcaceae bacterium]|nr:hypothetical protein [Oscillospiraceae bacterium]